MAKKLEPEAPRTEEHQGPRPTKMSMVEAACTALGPDARLTDLQDHIRKEFGEDLDKGMISQYRSKLNRKSGQSALQRKPGGNHRPHNSGGVEEVVEFIGVLREWELRIGAAAIKEVVEALYGRS